MRWTLFMQYKHWAAFIHDMIWVPVALLLAFWVRLNFEAVTPELFFQFTQFVIVALPVQVTAFYLFGLYRGMWRFASIPDLMRILQSVWIGTAVSFVAIFFLDRLSAMPRSVLLLYPMFLMLGVATPRLVYRWFKDHRLGLKAKSGRRALVLGAGRAGDLLIRDLIKHESYMPVGILDDAKDKQNRELHGIRILGPLSELESVIAELAVDIVLVAIPTARAQVMRKVFDVCSKTAVECVTLPSIIDLADGQVGVSRLREIRLEDLLGRDVIKLNDASTHALLDGKRVMITGAGGSIGSELVRQVAGYRPSHLLLVEQGEFNLYSIDAEVKARESAPSHTALLGDVRDNARMREIFASFKPQIVLHAAAYKHVPLVEDNPIEGIKTNILGTKVIADLAMEYNVERFVFVSTDKAVNPTNVMGATKRVAEIYCQGLNGRSNTAFITTRFGNVLGSAGSVVPLFKKQIETGGPVTVTHPEITRFFMTIPEAVSLILQATSMGNGGEIYVLDMGEPVKIVDLAKEMIRLSGYIPDEDIEIKFIGLRPGEKLYEELFHEKEQLVGTGHQKILRANFREVSWPLLLSCLQEITRLAEQHDEQAMLQHLHQLVPEFQVRAYPLITNTDTVIPLDAFRR